MPSRNERALLGLKAVTTLAALSVLVLTACERAGSPRSPSAVEGPKVPSADALRAATAACKQVSTGKYKLDAGADDTVAICGLEGAVFWTADLDVDCDGVESTRCNKKADPDYQADTAAHDSQGNPLNAALLPYVVVPAPGDRWNYKQAGLRLGRSVVAVIHGDRVAFGVIGDVGPRAAIGEASYAMAERLGMSPDPRRGGVASGVTYIAFTGEQGVTRAEDTAEAERVGAALAAALVRPR